MATSSQSDALASQELAILAGLTCPSWCSGGHVRAYEEGCPLEDSLEHRGDSCGGWMPEVRNPIDKRVMRPYLGAWNMTIRQRPFPFGGGGALTETTIVVELDEDQALSAGLTSGEARVLARQLEGLADAIDGVR